MKPPEASLSVLMMSLASSAAMAMGLAPHPESGETSKDKNMAKFNIDLLLVLQSKTKGNLTGDEEKFLNHVIHDLQMKFVEMK
jgi:hypothetical protein